MPCARPEAPAACCCHALIHRGLVIILLFFVPLRSFFCNRHISSSRSMNSSGRWLEAKKVSRINYPTSLQTHIIAHCFKTMRASKCNHTNGYISRGPNRLCNLLYPLFRGIITSAYACAACFASAYRACSELVPQAVEALAGYVTEYPLRHTTMRESM